MTPIFEKSGLPAEAIEDLAQTVQQKVPLHRFGNPEEIAKAALFLGSDESSYLNATDIVVDGGYLAV